MRAWTRKVGLVCIVVLCCFNWPAGAGFPAKKYLNVQLIGQEKSLWCWAASAQMIMAFHRTRITQCRQASDQLSLTCCGNAPASGCDQGGWPEFWRYGFASANTSNAGLSWAELQGQIVANKPFAFSWHYNGCDDQDSGHMMVLSGYKTIPQGRFVRVHDPLPIRRGDVHWHPFEYYLDGDQNFCHWDDYYDISR